MIINIPDTETETHEDMLMSDDEQELRVIGEYIGHLMNRSYYVVYFDPEDADWYDEPEKRAGKYLLCIR